MRSILCFIILLLLVSSCGKRTALVGTTKREIKDINSIFCTHHYKDNLDQCKETFWTCWDSGAHTFEQMKTCLDNAGYKNFPSSMKGASPEDKIAYRYCPDLSDDCRQQFNKCYEHFTRQRKIDYLAGQKGDPYLLQRCMASKGW